MKLLGRIIISMCAVSALFLCGKGVLAYQSPGTPTGFVNDFANVLTVDQKVRLETALDTFQKETSNEISIVTITTLNDEPIENYANELFRDWGIGSKKNNNGVLVLAVINDRKLRIEVGYGLEGALPDLLTKTIQENEIVPAFKTENYADGLEKGVLAIMQATQGEYAAEPVNKKMSFSIEMIFFLLFFVFQFLFVILAPSKSWWLGGVLGGVTGAVIGVLVLASIWAILTGVIGVILGLVFDYFVSRAYSKNPDKFNNRGGGGFWGGFGGGGSSGGGFGGFGGGSSGGGGSSSSW